MQNDAVQQLLDVREALEEERSRIRARLIDIDRALNGQAVQAPSAQSQASPRRMGRPPAGSMSLREAVVQVLRNGPLDRRAILDGVQKLGYVFRGKDPLNSLGVLLYTNRAIKRRGKGVFGLR